MKKLYNIYSNKTGELVYKGQSPVEWAVVQEQLKSNPKFAGCYAKAASKDLENGNVTIDKDGIFTDSGRPGDGITRVLVADYQGNSLLTLHVPREKLVDYNGKLVYANPDISNNFGEVIGIVYGLQIATKLATERKQVITVYSDSKIAIGWVRNGISNLTSVTDQKQIDYIARAHELFSGLTNVKLEHISGDINPADLGNHR